MNESWTVSLQRDSTYHSLAKSTRCISAWCIRIQSVDILRSAIPQMGVPNGVSDHVQLHDPAARCQIKRETVWSIQTSPTNTMCVLHIH